MQRLYVLHKIVVTEVEIKFELFSCCSLVAKVAAVRLIVQTVLYNYSLCRDDAATVQSYLCMLHIQATTKVDKVTWCSPSFAK